MTSKSNSLTASNKGLPSPPLLSTKTEFVKTFVVKMAILCYAYFRSGNHIFLQSINDNTYTNSMRSSDSNSQPLCHESPRIFTRPVLRLWSVKSKWLFAIHFSHLFLGKDLSLKLWNINLILFLFRPCEIIDSNTSSNLNDRSLTFTKRLVVTSF